MWPDRIPALVIVDTGNDHITEIVLGEDLTANRTLTITTGDSDGEIHTPSLTGKNFVSKSNENYTAAAGEHVLYTLSSTDATLTLPTSPTTGDTVAVTAVSLTGGYQLTITGTTKNILLREGSATSCKLFITNDHLTLRYNGMAWCVLNDGRILHACYMSDTGSQSISTGIQTKVDLDTSNYDRGGLANTASSRVDILRDGFYVVTLFNQLVAIAAGKVAAVYIFLNGSQEAVSHDYAAVGGNNMGRYLVAGLSLSVGDYIEMYCYHDDSTSRLTHSTDKRPKISVCEVV